MKFEDFAGVFVAAFSGTLLAFLVALYGIYFMWPHIEHKAFESALSAGDSYPQIQINR